MPPCCEAPALLLNLPCTVCLALQLGPKHTLDLNLPAMPDIFHQATKIPDIEVNMPDVVPKVIDLSGLGPKKVYNITLPQV